jgi:hypothetical protein
MRKAWPKTDRLVIRGREFLQSDLVLIRKLIRDNPKWGRTKVSEEVCSLLNWRQENGRLKDRGCRVALLKLESLGFLQLPTKKLDRGGQPPCRDLVCELDETQVSQMPSEIQLQLVQNAGGSRIWNALIARHHYLGLATPVGRLIRYLIIGNGQTLGAISFSEAAWSITGRDDILKKFGVNRNEIRSLVISNNRFLILPHVRIPNLASRILAKSTKQVVRDWAQRFETRPLFIETFVDPARFEGTCYRAANWTLVGSTKGFSKLGASHRNKTSPKLLFMVGTTYNSQQFLRATELRGERRAA